MREEPAVGLQSCLPDPMRLQMQITRRDTFTEALRTDLAGSRCLSG